MNKHKRWWQIAGILPLLLLFWMMGIALYPAPLARTAIVLSDEVSVQRVFVPVVDEPLRAAPSPISLRGLRLNQVKRDLQILDSQGAYCFCDGDFRLSFRRFGFTIASFRGHLGETPPRLISSKPLSLSPRAAHRVAALLNKIAPR